MENNIVTINARKFDSKIHRSWKCKFLEENDDYYVFFGEFEAEVKHRQLGIIRPKTASYEYYWKNRFYNVFKFYEPDGEFRNFYCNVNLPPVFEDNVLNYVDLDIDILVWKDFSVEILDRDEYRENIKKFGYSAELQENVESAVQELLHKIHHTEFPFSA